jgi:hypothetical protein
MPPAKIKIPGTFVNPTAVAPVADPGVVFNFGLNLRYSMQAEEQPDGSRAEYITYEFIPSVKTQNYKFTMVSDFYYQVKDQSGNEWDNSQIDATINNAWAVGDYFKLSPNLLIGLPLFKRTSDFNHFIGGRLTAALNSKNTSVPDFIFKYGLQFAKFSFKNDITGTNYNIDTRLRQRIHLGYNLTDSLMAMMYFHFDSNFLLDNSVKNNYYHETFVEYSFTENFNANLGISNGGGIYKGENQEEDNLNFYDKNSTEIFAGVGFSF